MTHYRQIIINLSVEDGTEEKKLEELHSKVEGYINGIKPEEVKDVEVKLN